MANPGATKSSAYGFQLLIKDLLNTPLAHAPRQEIVFRGELRYDYTMLRERIGRLANALSALGVGHGSTVAIMDWDSHRYLECYFAVPMMGAVLQTVNVRLSPDQILYTLNHAGADVLFVHSDFIEIVEEIRDKLATVRQFILLDDTSDASLEPQRRFLGEYETLVAAAARDFDFPDLDENTRATTFYTTGTTGDPKGVYFSHRQLVVHTLATMAGFAAPASRQRFHRGDVYMPITPMFHVHAWGFPYVATLMGVKQVYPGRYDPDLLVGLIQSEGVTFSHCVPTILRMILEAKSAEGADLSNWKVVVGGAAFPQGLAKQARLRGIDVWAGYGMSETCPFVTTSQSKPDNGLSEEEELSQRCKTGLPVPLLEARIVDDDMREIVHDGKSTGELVVRAPWLTEGYFRNAEASEDLWRGGYLHTQDIATIDPEGYVQITDRLKDVIKSGGEWISSLEIENLISQHPAVRETAVFGMKDEKWGERPAALVVLKKDVPATEAEIRAHLKSFADAGVISRYALPQSVRIVAEIEKTSVDKINKKLIRERYG